MNLFLLDKCNKVIEGCNTLEQLTTARMFTNLAIDRIFPPVSSTSACEFYERAEKRNEIEAFFRNIIQEKQSQIGGKK